MKAVKVGVLSAVSPIPVFFVTILWSWFVFFGVGMGVLGYETTPDWMLIVSLLPLLVSPCLGVFGIIYGVIRCKDQFAWLGILLSVLCLAENALLWYWMFYIGSRY